MQFMIVGGFDFNVSSRQCSIVKVQVEEKRVLPDAPLKPGMMTEKLELAFHSCHTRGSQDNQDSHDQDSNGDGDCQEGERKRLRGGRHSCHTNGDHDDG